MPSLRRALSNDKFFGDALFLPVGSTIGYLGGSSRYHDKPLRPWSGTEADLAGWDYETGALKGALPTGRQALEYQAYSERLARQRQNQLFDDAHRAMQLGEQSLTQYRNNAASALRSGIYQSRAQLYANQAQTIEPFDVLSGFREEQRQRALRDAKKARRRAEAAQIIGAVVGVAATAVTGGAAAGLLAGVGAGAAALANRDQQNAAEAQAEGEALRDTPQGAGGGLTLPGGARPFAGGPASGQGGGGGLVLPGAGSPPQAQSQQGPVGQGNLRLEGGAYGQQQGPPGQRQLQPQGSRVLSQGQPAAAYVGQQPQGQGQQMRLGQPGTQGLRQQQGMGGGVDVVGTASRLAYASVVADDDTLDQIEVGLAMRTQFISSGRYAEAV